METNGLENKEVVYYQSQGNVGTIVLNRPDKRNALNLAVWEAIDKAVEAAENDVGARVVILRGEGKSFCAGLELSPQNELMPLITAPASAAQKIGFYNAVRRLQEIHNHLERLSKPTIAAIHGHCLGAGLELVLCCDIRLCSTDAVFALPEAKLAIITDVGGLQRLPKVVGQGHAREIAYRGGNFSSERAKAINLVNDVYPDKESMGKAAFEMACEIAGNPPLAVQGAKKVFLFGDGVSQEQSLDYNAAMSSMIIPSEDIFEAMAAHLEKRKGQFKGN
jgi:enoyl-CoA hydratase